MIVTGSRVFSSACPLGSLGPELTATLFQPNPRSGAGRKDANWEVFKYQKLDSSVIPTPLAHADNQGEGHPRGEPSQDVNDHMSTIPCQ
ncbi:hypothetical protein TNCV_3035621 [Trichonephila clavipes]|nr:hypothetical protein TNCV_3035621 [Trichonephila clavipes]